MRKFLRYAYAFALAAVLALCMPSALFGCNSKASTSGTATSASVVPDESALSSAHAQKGASAASGDNAQPSFALREDGTYTDKDRVAAYIHEFGHLPPNYVSKTKARKAGWVSSEGNLWEVLPGKSIGGSEYYDDDDQLPDARGRRWTECDIDYSGGYRNAKRIVFSNDGLVFYTDDHYKTFERLY